MCIRDRRNIISHQTLLCGTPSSSEISVSLQQNLTVTEHISQLRNMLAILDRRLERLRKVFGNQERKVRIIRLHIL